MSKRVLWVTECRDIGGPWIIDEVFWSREEARIAQRQNKAWANPGEECRLVRYEAVE
jgi:hypothetical protein